MSAVEKNIELSKKSQDLQGVGIGPKFIANLLNSRDIKRKTNSPYKPITVSYVTNGYQNDENVVNIIDELHSQYITTKEQVLLDN